MQVLKSCFLPQEWKEGERCWLHPGHPEVSQLQRRKGERYLCLLHSSEGKGTAAHPHLGLAAW